MTSVQSVQCMHTLDLETTCIARTSQTRYIKIPVTGSSTRSPPVLQAMGRASIPFILHASPRGTAYREVTLVSHRSTFHLPHLYPSQLVLASRVGHKELLPERKQINSHIYL